jgi:predicted RNA-binding Zn-ribbon protein involved in translation (DUF1610 family)
MQLTIPNYVEALHWYLCSKCGYSYNEFELPREPFTVTLGTKVINKGFHITSIACPKCGGDYAYSWFADASNQFNQKEADRKCLLPYIFEEKYGGEL